MYLSDEHHIRRETESLQFQLADVRLQQHVDFRRRFLDALLDGYGHPLQQFRQLDLLLLPYSHKLELLRQGEEAT